MHCLMIYAHPGEKSLSGALGQAFLEGLRAKGHSAEVIDLYREQFDPALAADELYTREGFQISTPVKAYQEQLQKADIIALAFPTWWQGTPAILKGFLDRVLTPGVAFEYQGRKPKGLFTDKVAVILNCYDASAFEVRSVNGDRAFKVLQKDVFGTCGIRKIFRVSVFSAGTSSERYRRKMLESARKLGMEISTVAMR
ncbi:MAG TPA: NAD(P)H-dependent oxidoreductase [Bacillota bacterium]